MANQNAYITRQPRESMRQGREGVQSSSSSIPASFAWGERVEEEPHSQRSSSEGDSPRRGRRPPSYFNDFKVDIPECEGKLDSNEFLEWMQTIERIFEYKEILEDKTVKLIALTLRMYASLWWTNLLTKRVRQGKGKIWTW